MSVCTTNTATTRHPVATSRPGLFGRLRLALAVRRQRLDLARLDATRLSDIGLTPDRALAESQRPLWDVPHNWLR